MSADTTTVKVLLLVSALIAPFLLIPIERALPYPYLIEELVKLAFVLVIIRLLPREQKNMALIWGAVFLFSISESILYLFNIFQVGKLSHFLLRILLTFPLHLLTTLCIYWGRRAIWSLVLGFGVATLLHYLFNVLVALYQ